VAQKKSRTFRNYNGAYSILYKAKFPLAHYFVDQYVLLFTYKFQ